MKPRRENGATLVSPMTSDVGMGSALMMDFLWHVWGLRSSPDPCSKPARESFGPSVRTKATLESSISRLLLNPNLAKKAAPQDGYPGTAFSRQSPRNANHQPARMRLVPEQKR